MNIQEKKNFDFSIIRFPLFFVFTIWLIYWIEITFQFNFNKFGVFPRTFSGFRGVVLTHFIHSDANHLFNNSVPLFVLLTALFTFYKEVSFKVILIGGLLTGFLTWCIAREAFHIGASGIVYLLFSFIFFSGIIKKHYRLIALSLVVIFLYGSMIWFVLPIKEGMSWEGHLSGFIVGGIFAILFKSKGIVKEEYTYSKTDFDLLFDEKGNFVLPNKEERVEEEI